MIPIAPLVTAALPSVIEGVTQLLKRNSEKKSTIESRLELVESGVTDLGKSVLQLSEALQTTARALEAADLERKALVRKVKTMSIALGIVALAVVGALVALLLR